MAIMANTAGARTTATPAGTTTPTAPAATTAPTATVASRQAGAHRAPQVVPTFERPGTIARLRGMLGVDFYRLFHTPMLGIFLGIAALIPALVLCMGGDEAAALYGNTWQIIAAPSPLYVVSDMGEYANMNMVYIFGGIMVSIFIGRDYQSGYVKQLFTSHPHKIDYLVSKTIVGAFSMLGMCGTYLAGSIFAGVLAGTSFAVDPVGLVLALASKAVLCLGWSSLYTFLNIIFRRKFGIAIALCFVLGTGIPVMGLAAVLGSTPVLSILLYGASVNACLGSTVGTFVGCAAVSLGWTAIYTAAGTLVLSRCDVY